MSSILLIHTALLPEAKPLISAFNLSKFNTFKAFQLFANNNIYLCVGGIGKLNTAVCLGAVCSYLATINNTLQLQILNIGICGARDLAIGSLAHVIKCIDRENGNVYYTDQIIKPVGVPIIIETHNTPVTDFSILQSASNAVDMELSAFFKAGKHFCSTTNLQSLKIISDNFTADCSAQKVLDLISNNITEIKLYVNNLIEYSSEQAKVINSNEQHLLESINTNLKLTKTQQSILKDKAIYSKIKNGLLPAKLEHYGQVVCLQADERKVYFRELCELLT